MTKNPLLLLVVLALGCATGTPRDCQISLAASPDIAGAREPELLLKTAERFLQAHCHCEFSPELKVLVTFGKETMSRDEEVAKGQCLGLLEPRRWHMETPELGSLDLVKIDGRGVTRANTYVMVFVFRGSQWFFYWPEPEAQRL